MITTSCVHNYPCQRGLQEACIAQSAPTPQLLHLDAAYQAIPHKFQSEILPPVGPSVAPLRSSSALAPAPGPPPATNGNRERDTSLQIIGINEISGDQCNSGRLVAQLVATLVLLSLAMAPSEML
jgi:hypothetical protein